MHPRQFATTAPDRAAVIMQDGGTLSYRELEVRANQGAHLLRESGLKQGDGLAILLENELPYFEIIWAAQRSGLRYTPISSKLTAEEVAYIVADSGARGFIFSGSFHDIAARAIASSGAKLTCFCVGHSAPGSICWSTARQRMPVQPIPDENAGVPMLYSSGTTGRPKGVRFDLEKELPEMPHPLAAFLRARFDFNESMIYLSPAPLYHAAPLNYCMHVHRSGGTAVVMHKFDAEQALSCIERYRVTHSQWTPTMFIRMLKLPDAIRLKYDCSSLRVAIHAAAPCPVPVKQAMIEWWGPIIYEYYSSTEGIGMTLLDSAEALRKPGSVGRPVRGILHIVGDDGSEQPPHVAGQIYFEGGKPFSYHNAPEKTLESRLEGRPGWSTVGDIGFVDEDGYLFLTDRKSFTIISGGVNIYPQEIENILITHPEVADVAVFGVPNDEFGEEVKAVIQPVRWHDAGPDLAARLKDFCRENLSSIKCPRSFDFEEKLPRHETGKLYKRLLRDRY